MTEFEKVSEGVNNKNYDSLDESCIYWCRGDKCATVNFPSGSKLYNKVKSLARMHSDVQIHSDNGVLVAEIPVKYIRISAPRVLTEDQKKKAAENIQKARSNRG